MSISERLRSPSPKRTAAPVYGDPVWLTAKYPGQDVDGKPFKKGERVLYWPRTKTFMTGQKAEAAWRKFQAEVEDEAFYNRSYSARSLSARLRRAAVLPVVRILIEKVATDNGFHLRRQDNPRYKDVGDWMAFGSSQTPVRIWIKVEDYAPGKMTAVVAVSSTNVALKAKSPKWPLVDDVEDLPRGAKRVLRAVGRPSLHNLVRAIFQAAREGVVDESLEEIRQILTTHGYDPAGAEKLEEEGLGPEEVEERAKRPGDGAGTLVYTHNLKRVAGSATGPRQAAVSLKVKVGTRVKVNANPVSRMLYNQLPPNGAEGVVTTLPGPGGRRSSRPGPGGGLVYVDFDDYRTQGVSSRDLDLA